MTKKNLREMEKSDMYFVEKRPVNSIKINK
jgi:hypothetical protein